jgi:hypothetical protein
MLGRKTYTQEELDNARSAVDGQLAAYKQLVKAIDATSDRKAKSALEAFEPLFAESMMLALDRRFVHRLRVSTGKDGNPLNEVELLTESVLNNGGVLRGNNVIRYVPDDSVLKLGVGDRIRLGVGQFQKLSKGFLAEIESRFM